MNGFTAHLSITIRQLLIETFYILEPSIVFPSCILKSESVGCMLSCMGSRSSICLSDHCVSRRDYNLVPTVFLAFGLPHN